MTDLKQRVLEFLKYLGIGQLKFEEKVGLTRGHVDKIKYNLHPTTLSKILEAYPELNKTWLLTGDGEMLNSKLPKIETPPPSDTITMSREIFDKIMKLTDTISSQQETINSQSETIKMLAQRVPVVVPGAVVKMAAGE